MRTETVKVAKKERNITIKDVAKAANVSITTVSRVLNNNFYAVNDETRERVKAVIDELRFVPNAMARGLHSDKTKSVGLIIQDISNPYYPGIVQGVENTAQKLGYSLILANAQRSRTRTVQYLEIMREKRVDGMILAGGGIVKDADAQNLFESGDLRTVVIGKPTTDCVSVRIDNQSAGRMACEYLIERGHRNIAMITGVANSNTASDREIGYHQALAAHGIEPRKKWVVRGNFVYEGGYAAIDKLPLAETPKITAIFAQNDLMAIGAINALQARGYRVPDDISVIGFDDIQLSSYFSPTLTTVQVPFFEMGRRAMEVLVKMLNGKRADVTTYMQVKIKERSTVRQLSPVSA